MFFDGRCFIGVTVQIIRFLVGKSKKKRVTDKESNDFAYICTNLKGL